MIHDEESLAFVKCLQDGEERAIARLVDDYLARLQVAAYELCGNWTDAQDLASVTLERAVISVGAFRGDSCLYTWLYGILKNLSRMLERKRRRSREVAAETLPEVPAEDADVAKALDGAFVADHLARALGRLSPCHRDVLVRRFFEDQHIAEIAHALRLSPGTVKSRLHNALLKLRAILGEA